MATQVWQERYTLTDTLYDEEFAWNESPYLWTVLVLTYSDDRLKVTETILHLPTVLDVQ